MVKDFAAEMALKGMVVDVAIHAPDAHSDERNFHVHMLLTMREITPEGFGNKVREWNKEAELAQWKERWSELGAIHLARAGFHTEAERFVVGHLTLEKQRQAALQRGDHDWAQTLDREPAKHMGPEAAAMEKQGIRTRKGEHNRDIEERNESRAKVRDLSRTDGEIRLAYQLTDSAQAFADALEDRGLILARIGPQDLPNLAELERRHHREKEADQQRKLDYLDKRISEEKETGNLAKAGELETKREKLDTEYKDGLPWMVRQGGLDGLSASQRETAQSSYDDWKYKKRYSLEDYVSYVQKRWQERPVDSSRFRAMDLVVVNQRGEVYAVAERNTGEDSKLLKQHLKGIDKAPLFSVTGAWEVLRELHHHRREEALWPERERVWPVNPPVQDDSPPWAALPADALLRGALDSAKHQLHRDHRPLTAPEDLNKPRSNRFPEQPEEARIWEAYNRNNYDPKAFERTLDEHGIILCAVTKSEADRSYRAAQFAKEIGRYSPVYRDNEIVAIGETGRVYKLNEAVTGDDRRDIAKLLNKIDKTQLQGIDQTRQIMEERAEAREAAGQLMARLFPLGRKQFERSLASELRYLTRSVRQVATRGLGTAGRAGNSIGKVLDFGANLFESLFAPILTPEQKLHGEIAALDRREAAEQAERQRTRGRDW